ncbi:coiled-coil domain-containing protein 103 [Monomorium pharaonis]|uniref:coiled-coil domain-containing protein 103 n=1 Tax=Monomorium pharaonis TaxID=307658 RepID=UPI00063F908C|nr:coiled-coil domain-containing protein 103 [Monomorium pharaonis]
MTTKYRVIMSDCRRTRAENVLKEKKAMSVLKAPIDYKNLEEELHAALAADELYKLQNDAKIRAIEQSVPTYEHFRQMVNGAHLKPLNRDDMKPKTSVQWNPLIKTVKPHDLTASAASKKLHNKESNESIVNRSRKTCEDFLQSWKTITDHSDKFTYIWNLRNDLHHVFRVEIPASFLVDLTNTCLQHSSRVDDITPVVELLDILSACNRFDLMVCFMSRDEKSTCEELFQQLQLKGRSLDISLESTIRSLAMKYRINLN